MTQNNKETMQRAIGILEGTSWLTDEKTSEAILSACEMLLAVLNDDGGHT